MIRALSFDLDIKKKIEPDKGLDLKGFLSIMHLHMHRRGDQTQSKGSDEPRG